MEEQKTTSTSSTSSRRGGRGNGDVEKDADDNHQLSAATIVDEDLQRKMEKARLTQDLVFSNDLITDKMWSHLNFSDLKMTREVSRDFFQAITNFNAFKNFAVLKVTKESVTIPHLFDKNASMTTWNGIQIEVDLPLNVLDKIRHILEHVQFVSLLTNQSKSNSNIDRVDEFRNESYVKFIAGVLSSTPKLTCLQMDVRLLENSLNSEVWSSPTIRDNFKNLKSFELPHMGRQNHKKIYGTKVYAWLAHIRPNRSSEFASNLDHLESTLQSSALKTLRLSKYILDNTRPSERQQAPPITTSLLDLFRSHRETLVEVSIPVDVWKSFDDIRTLIFPQLKTLIAAVSFAASVTFESFLTNHPKLEQLDIFFYDGGTNWQHDMGLWGVIKQHCSVTGMSLKKLHIEISDYFLFLSCCGANVDWTFLEGMKNLEDFRVESTQGSLGWGLRFLECLPRNQKLDRLSLNGMHVERSFWRYRSERHEPANGGGISEVPLDTKLELLRGFKNLKRLSFRHSPNAVNDEVMQFILTEMTSLEELEVSHCSRLTDVGISGTGPQEERVSLQSLKELKLLSIRACPLVTPEGLLSVLALPLLQQLDYYTASPVPKFFVRGIAAQNPSLETISVHTTDDSNDPHNPSLDIDNCALSTEEKKAFFKKHPRITALNNLEKLKRDTKYASNAEED